MGRDRGDSWRGINSLLPGLIDLFIDFGDLLDPDLSLSMFHGQDIVYRPVEVVCDVRYLLVDALQGVADYSPRSVPRSKSYACPHDGHFVLTDAEPSSLTRR